MESNHNVGNSLFLFIAGQVSYLLSIITNLEVVFKILSIVSVTMVIIINWKHFVNKLKGIFKSRSKQSNEPNDFTAIHPDRGQAQAHDEKD